MGPATPARPSASTQATASAKPAVPTQPANAAATSGKADRRSSDRRSLRSQRALRSALAEELASGEDIARVSVAALTERAGLTRRTFYSHYKDIPDFIEQVEEGILDDVRVLIRDIANATLPDLYHGIEELEPAPGSVELLRYVAENHELIGSLLGPGGDQGFIKKVIDLARSEVAGRMQTGIFPGALGAFFDYYLTSVVTSEVGLVQRWFEHGLAESPETMARIMTVIAFIRPGDLYGMPIDINVPEYGMKLMGLNLDNSSVSSQIPTSTLTEGE
ncbi:MAG: TetR/AcrR family transcriptional regulator C-terminal domain-containing protein [Coriobacteriaceae bacterium]|nr:TetR/AcrR family transcriptional regulator C-terminal domain-containing protein [Coriobacteriaceae bacterium]